MDIPMKQCSTCKEFKPLDEFRRQADKILGRQSRCRLCVKISEWKKTNAKSIQHTT